MPQGRKQEDGIHHAGVIQVQLRGSAEPDEVRGCELRPGRGHCGLSESVSRSVSQESSPVSVCPEMSSPSDSIDPEAGMRDEGQGCEISLAKRFISC